MGVDRAVLFRMATSEPLERLAKAVPGGEAAAWRAAPRYVAGRSRAEALSTTAGLLARGHGVSVDLFGELVPDPAIADRVVEITSRWQRGCRHLLPTCGSRWT